MIPERIALQGFLSYEDEQVLCFDQAPLWLLAGPNGSGKSSVFDGITFALFSGHRGGERDYHELINKNCDSGAVEFDFRLDQHRYRVHRALKRTSQGKARCTQQVRHWDGERWEVVPDTTKAADFDRWIQDNLGMNYRIFSASVLLAQGRAERLLTSEPKERHEMLASIIDLDRYARLHERAAARRRDLDAKADVLRIQLEALPEVTAEQLQAAEAAIAAGEAAWQSAQTALEQLQMEEALARQWAELRQESIHLAEAVDPLRGVLAQADTIHRDGARLHDLMAVVPTLQRLINVQESLDATQRALAQAEVARQAHAEQVSAMEQTLGQGEQKLRQRDERIATAEQRRRQLAISIQELALALQPLRTLYHEREQLRQHCQQAAARIEDERTAAARLVDCEMALARLREEHEQSKQRRLEADHAVTRRNTLWDEARQRALRFYGAVGEKLCRYCGQTLTAEHVQTEKTKLEKDLTDAAAAHERACQEQAACVRLERCLEERLAESTRGQGALQQRLTQLQRQRERAEDAAAICERELVRVYGALAESFREKVAAPLPANWLATCFPTGPELTAFDAELESRKREDAQLERQLGELGRQRTVDQQEEQRLRRDLERTQERLAELQRHQAVQEALRASAQEALMTARCDVPPAWDSELRSLSRPRVEALQEELADLRRQDLGTRLRDLERAQNDLDRLQARQQELAHRQAAIPEPARREPEDVARRLAIARQQEKQCQSRLLQARHEEQRLEERRNARAALEETRSNVLKEHGQYSLLAKYLDRDWLQRHLMRQAEQTIVAYARDILDRLSGGQLALQQRAEEGGDKALVLEVVNRAATEASPHRVDMLSGSERFRAAVSLALAIGQFASRQHRPIQSVIIDEGFGCLDPANRQLMIQELHNLQGQLQRILLVSHQEEFADAFTNGYRFELDHGATRVTRFAG